MYPGRWKAADSFMRTEESRLFIRSYFEGSPCGNAPEFIRLNGLAGFPNVNRELFKQERFFYSILKKRLFELYAALKRHFPAINFIHYKGIYMNEFYPEGNMRVFSDIDLLLRRKDFRYLSRFFRREDNSLAVTSGDLSIELKNDFFDPFFTRYISGKQGRFLKDVYAKALYHDPRCHFILLCMHNFAHQFSRLDRFFDLHFLISSHELKISSILSLAREYDLGVFVKFNVRLMAVLGFPGTEDVLLNPLYDHLLKKLYDSGRNRFKIMLLLFVLPLPLSIVFLLEKILFLDVEFLKYKLKKSRL